MTDTSGCMFGTESGQGPGWALVDRIFASPVLPLPSGFDVLRSLVLWAYLRYCMWTAVSLLQAFPVENVTQVYKKQSTVGSKTQRAIMHTDFLFSQYSGFWITHKI